MRIHKIRFENIHSLRGEHEIDFVNGILSEAGLFAITGPTGSGKSTLLDVITLALFNKIARIHSNVSNTILEEDGGVMTRNTQSCYAEVEYSCKGKMYLSHWSISRNRKNNLSPRKQELVLIDTGEILESGTKTPDKNEEIIGLSYAQFVKAIVLAQGEFSKLLQASRNERNKLLEDITGARHFRRIGIAVYERQGKIKNEIDLKKASLEGIHLLTEEETKLKTDSFKKLNEKKSKLARAADDARKKVEIRVELDAKQKDYEKLKNDKAEYEKKLQNHLSFNTQLETHERLVKHLETIRNHDGFLKNLSDLKEAENSLNKEISNSEFLQKKLVQETSELLKNPTTVENAVKELEIFRETIEKLSGEEKTKRNEAALYESQIKTLKKSLSEKGYDLPSTKIEFEEKLKSYHSQFSAFISSVGVNSADEAENQLKAHRRSQEQGMNLLSRKEAFSKIKTDWEKTIKQIDDNERKIAANNKEKEEAEERLKILLDEVLTLEKAIEHQLLHQNLEEYRLKLKDHEPCPLCGALEHPYATENVVVDIQDELLKEKKKSQTKETRLIASLESSNEVMTRENKRLEIDKAGNESELEQLKKQLEDLASLLEWNWKLPLAELEQSQKEISLKIENLEKTKQAIEVLELLSYIESNYKLWQEKESMHLSVKKAKEKLYKGSDINQEVAHLSSRINRNSAQLEELRKQFRKNARDQEMVKEQLENEKLILSAILKQENLPSIDALRNGIMKEERAKEIRDRQNELSKENVQLQEREKHLLTRIKELIKDNDASVSLDQLRERAKSLKKESDDIQMQIGRLSQELEQNEQAQKRFQTISTSLEALKKDEALWKKMNDLIGDKQGNKFSRFVQDLTLKQLISYTNNRLREFSDRYILDAESVDGNTDNLYILDQYMGNSRRSVKTLSGGETFLVSLAMAFALSDIAARHVKIESLFIDEGFGTLDPETLDQAITVLEKMQNESNRSIGIISHVDELKKRITAQIRLEKHSLGNSTLEVTQSF